jgi:hypothetical protein
MAHGMGGTLPYDFDEPRETKPKINNYTYLNVDGIEVPY